MYSQKAKLSLKEAYINAAKNAKIKINERVSFDEKHKYGLIDDNGKTWDFLKNINDALYLIKALNIEAYYEENPEEETVQLTVKRGSALEAPKPDEWVSKMFAGIPSHVHGLLAHCALEVSAENDDNASSTYIWKKKDPYYTAWRPRKPGHHIERFTPFTL